jgi:SAM-dependent methyltransferase
VETSAAMDPPLLYLDLMLSLGIQSQKTGYAWFVENTERPLLERAEGVIRDQIAREKTAPLPILVPLLLTLMYRDPVELDYLPRLTGTDIGEVYPPVTEFIESARDSYAQETRLAGQFAAQAKLSDGVSDRVATMYESAPYPHYHGAIPAINPKRRPYPEAFGLHKAPAFEGAAPGDCRSILIAGCGTGLHPIAIAEGFPWMRVTAIDISCRSLAYAQLSAEKRGIQNLSFRRCDILDVPNLGLQFDVIEAVGVLHHMREPEAGLRALLSCLKPGGIMKLGLYSRLGRQSVIRFRAQNPMRSTQLDDEAVRQIRYTVLTAPPGDPSKSLLKFRDFYSLNGVRDLILHEQEWQFSIAELQSLLVSNGLAFVKFTERDGIYRRLRSTYGKDANPYDLVTWRTAESKLPDLFAGMYEFFTRRAGGQGPA